MGSHLPGNQSLPIPEMYLEFAHVYADSIFSEEQDDSLKAMKVYLDRESHPTSLVVSAILIDDLHVEEQTLDVNEFIRCILRRGLAPDHVVFEGRLGPVALELSQRLPADFLSWEKFSKLEKKVLVYQDGDAKIGLLTKYEDGREEWSCAILSAAWSLCRAGVFPFPEDSIIRLTEAPVIGKRIVSVLHTKYQSLEAKVERLIKAAGFDEIINRLEPIFFS